MSYRLEMTDESISGIPMGPMRFPQEWKSLS